MMSRKLYSFSKAAPALCSLTAFFILSPLIFAQSQTPSAPAATPAAAPKPSPALIPTGTIKGRVATDDGRVLANTMVVARALSGALSAKSSQVNSEGRFLFDDLPAGVYIILAVAPGYVDDSLLSADFDRWPKHLIGADLRINMVKGGVITGLVTNAKGQPVVGVPVQATLLSGLNLNMNQFGAGASETDDRGVYRLYGLPPGQYTVEASGKGIFGRGTAGAYDLDAPTYYPSSNRDTAVPVTVRAGEETQNIDIKYRGLGGRSISGTMVSKLDVTSNIVNVILTHADTLSLVGMAIITPGDQNRSFVLNAVADGDYDLIATFLSDPTDTSPAIATKRITVRGEDVTGIELVLARMAAIGGNFTLQPIKPEDKCDKRNSQLVETLIETPRDDAKPAGSKLLSLMARERGGTIAPGGDFKVINLYAGTYRLQFALPTDAWYVRTINLPSGSRPQPLEKTTAPRPATSMTAREASTTAGTPWQGTFTLKSGETLKGISVLIGQDAAGLSGRLAPAAEKSELPPNFRVHLVPAEPEEAMNVLRYFEAGVDSNRSFALKNIAPGRYFIIPRLEPPAKTDRQPRPIALDPAQRARLRREAETLKNTFELKPCQRVDNVELKLN